MTFIEFWPHYLAGLGKMVLIALGSLVATVITWATGYTIYILVAYWRWGHFERHN